MRELKQLLWAGVFKTVAVLFAVAFIVFMTICVAIEGRVSLALEFGFCALVLFALAVWNIRGLRIMKKDIQDTEGQLQRLEQCKHKKK